MPDRHSLRHDLDGATPEEQAIHLALQREVEVDLTGYATEKWVKAQQYVQKPENLLGNTPPIPEPQPDIDLDGYATTEYVDEKTQGVEDASVIRDELLSNKIEDEVKGNTAAHLVLESDIQRVQDQKYSKTGGKITGLVTCAKPGTGNTYVFECRVDGLPENKNCAFRVTGDGNVKAGHDTGTPFIAKAKNDVVTKACLDQAIAAIPEPAPRLPGFTWNYKAYADEANKAPVTPGEFTWNEEDSTFYISCTSACGILLGNQQSSFARFVTQAVMTIYEQGMVLRALAQVVSIELKNYAGQHYFQIVRGGYARQTLNAGKSYNITLSGVF